MIHGFVEFDVADARGALRRLAKRDGEAPSLTALLIACCARAVDAHPSVHAYRNIRNRLVMFDDVDVSVTVERVVNGSLQVVPTIIRAANRKPPLAIHREIQSARTTSVETSGVFRSIRLYLLIPPFIRRLVFKLLDRAPLFMKRRAGTIMVTSVGMFGTGAGWGLPIATHTCNMSIGGVVERPVRFGGSTEFRDHVCVTLSFDHDIVDGAPAARFVRRLRREIKHAAELIDTESG